MTPAAHTMVRVCRRSLSRETPEQSQIGYAGAEADLDAELFKRTPCGFRQRRAE